MANVFQFILIIVAVVTAVTMMIRAGDSGSVRRLSAALAIGTVFFSGDLADLLTILFGASLEVFVAAVGVGFFIVLCLTVMLIPLLFAIYKLVH